MSHGAHCDCMVCGVGKKLGMIENGEKHEEKEHHEHEEHHDHGSDKKTCEHCA